MTSATASPATKIGSVLTCIGLAASGPASAALCSITGGTILPSSGTCIEVSAKVLTQFGGSQGTPIPPNYAFSPGGGSASAITADEGGEASATAIAQLGLLRLTATSNVSTPNTQTAAQARAAAAFGDFGTVTSPGGSLGDLVHAFVTVDIQGLVGGGAGIIESHLNVGGLYNVNFPSGTYSFTAHVGDVIPVSLGLSIYADSSYLVPVSSADFGNSAHLYIDFDEAGVFFDSAGGHDYSSVAVVPAPAAGWLLATGLAGLGGRRWARRTARD